MARTSSRAWSALRSARRLGCSAGDGTVSINQPKFWKFELFRECSRLREFIDERGVEWVVKHSAQVERFTFVTAYIMRKLHEADVLTQEVTESTLRVVEFPCMKPPPHRRWFQISEDRKNWRQPLEQHLRPRSAEGRPDGLRQHLRPPDPPLCLRGQARSRERPHRDPLQLRPHQRAPRSSASPRVMERRPPLPDAARRVRGPDHRGGGRRGALGRHEPRRRQGDPASEPPAGLRRAGLLGLRFGGGRSPATHVCCRSCASGRMSIPSFAPEELLLTVAGDSPYPILTYSSVTRSRNVPA